ncbi:MAG: hypothetical protein EOO22_17715, partial [Comamonadaceae bacterium]
TGIMHSPQGRRRLLAAGIPVVEPWDLTPTPLDMLVGFGDLAFSADLEPALTTVRIDGNAIGRQAAQFIVDRAEGREVAQRVVDIGFSIVERAST